MDSLKIWQINAHNAQDILPHTGPGKENTAQTEYVEWHSETGRSTYCTPQDWVPLSLGRYKGHKDDVFTTADSKELRGEDNHINKWIQYNMVATTTKGNLVKNSGGLRSSGQLRKEETFGLSIERWAPQWVKGQGIPRREKQQTKWEGEDRTQSAVCVALGQNRPEGMAGDNCAMVS